MAAAGDTTHCLRQQQRETPLGYHPRIFKDMFWEEEMLAPRCVGRDVLCARAQLNCAVARVRFARRQARSRPARMCRRRGPSSARARARAAWSPRARRAHLRRYSDLARAVP